MEKMSILCIFGVWLLSDSGMIDWILMHAHEFQFLWSLHLLSFPIIINILNIGAQCENWTMKLIHRKSRDGFICRPCWQYNYFHSLLCYNESLVYCILINYCKIQIVYILTVLSMLINIIQYLLDLTRGMF